MTRHITCCCRGSLIYWFLFGIPCSVFFAARHAKRRRFKSFVEMRRLNFFSSYCVVCHWYHPHTVFCTFHIIKWPNTHTHTTRTHRKWLKERTAHHIMAFINQATKTCTLSIYPPLSLSSHLKKSLADFLLAEWWALLNMFLHSLAPFIHWSLHWVINMWTFIYGILNNELGEKNVSIAIYFSNQQVTCVSVNAKRTGIPPTLIWYVERTLCCNKSIYAFQSI